MGGAVRTGGRETGGGSGAMRGAPPAAPSAPAVLGFSLRRLGSMASVVGVSAPLEPVGPASGGNPACPDSDAVPGKGGGRSGMPIGAGGTTAFEGSSTGPGGVGAPRSEAGDSGLAAAPERASEGSEGRAPSPRGRRRRLGISEPELAAPVADSAAVRGCAAAGEGASAPGEGVAGLSAGFARGFSRKLGVGVDSSLMPGLRGDGCHRLRAAQDVTPRGWDGGRSRRPARSGEACDGA